MMQIGNKFDGGWRLATVQTEDIHMRDAVPYLVIAANCCIGPLLIFLIGVYIGRNGMPFELRRKNKNVELRRYSQ